MAATLIYLAGSVLVGGVVTWGVLAWVRGIEARRRLWQYQRRWVSERGFELREVKALPPVSGRDPFHHSGFYRHVLYGVYRGRWTLVAEWRHRVHNRLGPAWRTVEVVAIGWERRLPDLDIDRRRGAAQVITGRPGSGTFQASADPAVVSRVAGLCRMLDATAPTEPYLYRAEPPWVMAVRDGDLHVETVMRRWELLEKFASEVERSCAAPYRPSNASVSDIERHG